MKPDKKAAKRTCIYIHRRSKLPQCEDIGLIQ